jgi:hypothetical protein
LSVHGKLEGLSQVEGRLIKRQSMDCCPEVQYVSLERALRMEALEYVLTKMNRKRSLHAPELAVYRTGAAALLATTPHGREDA